MNGKDIGINLTPNMPIMEQRNRILSSSDVYVLEDHPTTKKTEWKTYRQELRDMDFSDLDNITWPTPPEEEE